MPRQEILKAAYERKMEQPTTIDNWVIKFDGGAWGNGTRDCKTSAGVVVYLNKAIIDRRSWFLGHGTNNTAEFCACIMAIDVLAEYLAFIQDTAGGNRYTVTIMGDSELVIKAITGYRTVSADNLVPLFKLAMEKIKNLRFKPTFSWCPREFNKDADIEAQRALKGDANADGK